MPIYAYRATQDDAPECCAGGFDRLQRLADEPLTTCPTCGGPVRRVISAPNLIGGDADLSRANLEKHGFTQYRKAGKGQYEKTAGRGPRTISGGDED